MIIRSASAEHTNGRNGGKGCRVTSVEGGEGIQHADEEPDTPERARQAGCVACFRRPFPGRKLMETIE
jgi:hypothetical protein